MATSTMMDFDISAFGEIPDPWSIVADIFDPPETYKDFSGGWTPYPKQKLASELCQVADELLFGGAAGPGKSELLMEYGMREMERYPGNRGVIFRRVLPSLKRSIIPRLKVKLVATGRAVWNENDKIFTFPNTSILELGSLQFADDVLNYQGAEYGWIGFEEVTEFLPSQYEYMLGRLRAPVDGVRPHVLCTANPGGANHGYYKRRFVKPPVDDLPDLEDENTPDDDPFSLIELNPGTKTIPPFIVWRPKPIIGVHTKDAPPLTRCFVPATHEDNPMLLKRDPGYLSRLRAQSNKGLRLAMEKGDWDAIEQIKGALWSGADLDEGRVNPKKYWDAIAPQAFLHRVVAIDPSSGKNDAFAIAVMARDMVTGQIYVEQCIFLEQMQVRDMAKFAIDIFNKSKADTMVVEKNHGGDWMIEVFRNVDPYVTIEEVWASKGKLTRAQPIAALFAMDSEAKLLYRARIVGNQDRLEEELTGHSFDADNPNFGDSPDGLDAVVWGGTYLTESVNVASQRKGDDAIDTRLAGRR